MEDGDEPKVEDVGEDEDADKADKDKKTKKIKVTYSYVFLFSCLKKVVNCIYNCSVLYELFLVLQKKFNFKNFTILLHIE